MPTGSLLLLLLPIVDSFSSQKRPQVAFIEPIRIGLFLSVSCVSLSLSIHSLDILLSTLTSAVGECLRSSYSLAPVGLTFWLDAFLVTPNRPLDRAVWHRAMRSSSSLERYLSQSFFLVRVVVEGRRVVERLDCGDVLVTFYLYWSRCDSNRLRIVRAWNEASACFWPPEQDRLFSIGKLNLLSSIHLSINDDQLAFATWHWRWHRYLQEIMSREHICRSNGYNFRFIGQDNVNEILLRQTYNMNPIS